MQVFTQLTREVEVLAAKDGIINRAEHILIDCLKFLKLPLFTLELVGYGAIVTRVFVERKDVQFNEPKSDHYCQEGIWNICLIITIVYSLVFVFRIIVIVASLVGKKSAPKAD